MNDADPEGFEEAVRALRRAFWSDGRDGRARVEGVDADGLLVVRVETGDSRFVLKVPGHDALQALIGPPTRPARMAPALPYVTRTGPHRAVVAREPGAYLRAGAAAQAVEGIDAVSIDGLSAAIYTCRGPTQEHQGLDYKPYNEDAVAMNVNRSGDRVIAAIGAFDQAGGEGNIVGSPGAASAEGAKHFNAAVVRILDGVAPEVALRDAVAAADAGVRALRVGAVSTFAAAVIIAEGGTVRATVVSLGDSRVLHVRSDGSLAACTRLHNTGARVSAGQIPGVPRILALQFAAGLYRGLGTDDAEPECESWELSPGDRVVVGSDGIGDARELEEMPIGVWHADACAQLQAQIVAATGAPSAAVEALVAFSLDQAADRYGKPDNIAVGVVQLA
jgi:serine/threonine protein phosphatase PrpC